MHSLTKASGVAVSVLVAATASVLLLLPGHSRMRTSRGAGMTPAIMVASATPPPPGPTLAVSGAAQSCLPPAAPAQHCRASGDRTGGARAATAGRRRCRHGPPATAPPYTARPRTVQPRAGQAGTGQPGTGQAGTGQAGTGQPGTGQPGTGLADTGWDGAAVAGAGSGRSGRDVGGRDTGGWSDAGATAAQRSPVGQLACCLTGNPRRPR